jgi:hypothetical protein
MTVMTIQGYLKGVIHQLTIGESYPSSEEASLQAQRIVRELFVCDKKKKNRGVEWVPVCN